jgi:CBS domain-containing protein
MMAIERLMSGDVVTATAGETVAAVVERMSGASVGAVVLLEGDELAGVFTERDLLKRVVAAGKDPAKTEVGEVATRDVTTIEPTTSLRDCAQTLRRHGVRHLPVVQGRRLVGIISARDFFTTLARELEGFIERSRYEEQLRENVDPYDHLGGSYGR